MSSGNPATPLGFQDLTEDERLIVAVYRDWRAGGPTSAAAEHAIARHLRRDRLYGAKGMPDASTPESWRKSAK
ncbi:MAG: hypothetical protein AAFP67_10560, partial [Pseudomonadota bacterium]